MEAPFANRQMAARLLAQQLLHLRRLPGVVLAVPRGALPMGTVIARALDWPLDVVLTKKLGHPHNPEFAIGAVSEQGYVLSPNVAVPGAWLTERVAAIQAELKTRRQAYQGLRPPQPLNGRPVVVVDDGAATGHTLLATITLVRQQRPQRIIVAVPVASPEALRRLQAAADEVVCLLAPLDFRAVGQYYQDFSEVTDEEALAVFSPAQHPAS
ncbi:phosphoribosyltransferase [Hymenobacter convexus]|uniref:phosphoribosyltransferase n=1 Tax=Hymenobacter sp. CA1UV-4 TaxID=3063782 RepID=UPI002713A20C|nr:phosphoribosyltransferase family protein [Hymenobacter sp. CA1UV-4]MDO7852464.1 phosphoribosyltransferase family protein [Hymenobacter sp. CA1UV-4]